MTCEMCGKALPDGSHADKRWCSPECQKAGRKRGACGPGRTIVREPYPPLDIRDFMSNGHNPLSGE